MKIQKDNDKLLRLKMKRDMAGIALRDDVKTAVEYAREAKHYIAMQVAENMPAMVRSMIKRSIDGDVNAFTALMDRAHGKPAQALEVGGKDGNPIVFMPLELIQKHALEVTRDVKDVKLVEEIPEKSSE